LIVEPSRDDLVANPYKPPTASLERPDPTDLDREAVALRRRNFGHEAGFRAMGMVNFLGAILDLIFIAVAFAYTLKIEELRAGVSSWGGPFWLMFLFVVLPALILIHLFIGFGLRRFRAWAFRGQVFLSAASIVCFFKSWAISRGHENFPDWMIVTEVLSAIAAFAILYYLLGSNARRLIAPDYRQAVVETQGLRKRWNWPLLVAIVPLSIAAEVGLINAMKDFSRLIEIVFNYVVGFISFS
jgi:hypothetical protein